MTKSRATCLQWTTSALVLILVGVVTTAFISRQRQVVLYLVPLLALLSVVLRAQERYRGFAFTAWVLAFVAAGMIWPQAFDHWFGYDLRFLIVPLVQVIMFGMGTKLSVEDFVRVLAMPKPVMIGLVLHFGIMPLAGFTLARAFGFPAEIAAGIILVGSVSSGVASNVIVYLAGGNVALAVTVTACSTLVSPVMTPLLMKLLAGRLVPINFLTMMLEVFNMVIVPVMAGLVAHRILYSRNSWFESMSRLGLIAFAGVGLAAGVALIPSEHLGAAASLAHGAVLGFALVGLVALTKLVVSLWLAGPRDWMERALPIVSMAGICVILAIIAARSRDRLLTVGAALIIAAILHNAIGYLLGYWLARAARLEESACRTIAVEVGMQNGGMATGLAINVLNSAEAALAPAIFGTWMNISGSILASWWRRRPATPPQAPAENASTDVANTPAGKSVPVDHL